LASEEEAEEPPLVIESPTNFKHVGGAGMLGVQQLSGQGLINLVPPLPPKPSKSTCVKGDAVP